MLRPTPHHFSPKVSGYIAQVLVGLQQHVNPWPDVAKIATAISRPRSAGPSRTSHTSGGGSRPVRTSCADLPAAPIHHSAQADSAAAEPTEFAQEEQVFPTWLRTGSGTVQERRNKPMRR